MLAKKNTKSKNQKLNILIANGVNLDLLGQREPAIYGSDCLADIERLLLSKSSNISSLANVSDFTLTFYQSNDEGLFLDEISKEWDGIVINPGAWTHTSLALADRLAALGVPYVEVHISNLANREGFRQNSYLAPKSSGIVQGFGISSYLLGLIGLLIRLKTNP